MAAVHAMLATGASKMQVFFNAVWHSVLPPFVDNHLDVREFNLRDSTILGFVFPAHRTPACRPHGRCGGPRGVTTAGPGSGSTAG